MQAQTLEKQEAKESRQRLFPLWIECVVTTKLNVISEGQIVSEKAICHRKYLFMTGKCLTRRRKLFHWKYFFPDQQSKMNLQNGKIIIFLTCQYGHKYLYDHQILSKRRHLFLR